MSSIIHELYNHSNLQNEWFFKTIREDVEGVKNVVSEFLGGKKNKEKNAT